MKDKLSIIASRAPKTTEEVELFHKVCQTLDTDSTEFLFLKEGNAKQIEATLQESKAIIPMGNVALKHVLGIQKIKNNRGKRLYSDRYSCKVYPTLLPYTEESVFDPTTTKNTISADIDFAAKTFCKDEELKHKYVTVWPDQREEFDRLMTKLSSLELFAFDFEAHEEANWDVNKTKILGVGFSWKVGTGVYVVLKDQHKDIPKDEYDYRVSKIKELLENNAEKIAHNIDYENDRALSVLGIRNKNLNWDTMLLHHLFDENNRHGLDALSSKFSPDLLYYKDESEVFLPNKNASFVHIPTGILARRCCADCDLTLRLYYSLRKPIEDQQLMPLYNQIVIPHRRVLTEGEMTGVRIDLDEMNRIEPIIVEKRDRTREALRELVKDKDFNPRSPQQVGSKATWLGLQSSKLTDTGAPSMDEEAMAEMMESSNSPFPKLMIEFRQMAKLHSTYIEGIRKRLVGDIIHTSFLVPGTVTGRLASRNPNLQNIPTDTTMIEEYQLPPDISIRKLFIPRDDHHFIISDGSQMELRVLAVMSQDPILVNAYHHDEDIHTKTALMIIPGAQDLQTQLLKDPNNEALKNKWKWMRKIAKGINFGIVYGRGAKTLAAELKISMREAQQFLDKYFVEYAGVYRWIQQTIGFAKRNGYVINPFGRRRRLLDINSPYPKRRAEAERQAQNSPIQGGAADCTAIANIRIASRFKKENISGQFRINVHDELVHEVHDRDIQKAPTIVEECWVQPIPRITVPLGVSIETGDRWEH